MRSAPFVLQYDMRRTNGALNYLEEKRKQEMRGRIHAGSRSSDAPAPEAKYIIRIGLDKPQSPAPAAGFCDFQFPSAEISVISGKKQVCNRSLEWYNGIDGLYRTKWKFGNAKKKNVKSVICRFPSVRKRNNAGERLWGIIVSFGIP